MSQPTSTQLQTLLLAGGSLVVDANIMTALALQTLAFAAKTNKSIIVIKNANKLTSTQCNAIAFAGGGQGNIVFDFS